MFCFDHLLSVTEQLSGVKTMLQLKLHKTKLLSEKNLLLFVGKQNDLTDENEGERITVSTLSGKNYIKSFRLAGYTVMNLCEWTEPVVILLE